MILKKNSIKGLCAFSFSGKFTFADHITFRTIISSIRSQEATEMHLELSGLEFVDSAALGMFLVARDEAKKNNVELKLLNATGHVQKMFTLSNFPALFRIE